MIEVYEGDRQACGNCAAWRQSTVIDGGRHRAPVLGRCHLTPPRRSSTITDAGTWPTTEPSMWCTQWSPYNLACEELGVPPRDAFCKQTQEEKK